MMSDGSFTIDAAELRGAAARVVDRPLQADQISDVIGDADHDLVRALQARASGGEEWQGEDGGRAGDVH